MSVAVTAAAAGIASQLNRLRPPARRPAPGPAVSSTVKVWLAVALLPQLSVTVQVRTIVPQPSTTLLTSLKSTVSVGSQLSVAVTTAAAGIASQAQPSRPPARRPAPGPAVSSTVRVWLAVALLPQLSVTVQVRTIVPQPSTTLLLLAEAHRQRRVAVVRRGHRRRRRNRVAAHRLRPPARRPAPGPPCPRPRQRLARRRAVAAAVRTPSRSGRSSRSPRPRCCSSLKSTVSVASQLSVAVTVGRRRNRVARHRRVRRHAGQRRGHRVLDGQGLAAVALLPQLSVTVQVRTIVPQPSTTLLHSR